MLVSIFVTISVSMMLCDVDDGNELDWVLIIVVGASVILTNSVSVI